MKHRVRSAVGLLALTAMVACTSRPEPRIEAAETMPVPSTVAPEATTSSTPPVTTKPKPLRPLGSLTFNRAFTAEEQAIAEAYADAEWWTEMAAANPADADLPEFLAAALGPELRSDRRNFILKDNSDGIKVTMPSDFRVRIIDVQYGSPTHANLSSCVTMDEIVTDATGIRTQEGLYSVSYFLTMDQVDGRWLLVGSRTHKQAKGDRCVF